MKQFSHVFLRGTKKRSVFESTKKSLFFLEALLRSLTVATLLGMSRAKLRVRHKWPNMYLCVCMVLHDIVVVVVVVFFGFFFFLFVYLRLLRCCMIYCYVYCLLKAFPNYHSVCHPSKNMYAPLSTTCCGSSHGSPVFIRFGYPVANSPTHRLKSLDHFPLTVKDIPYHLDQHNVHYITSCEV